MMTLAEQKQFKLLKDRVTELERQQSWMLREIKSGLRDVIERVVKQNIEIDVVEKSTEEQIKDLIR